jgi:hypothetical protein
MERYAFYEPPNTTISLESPALASLPPVSHSQIPPNLTYAGSQPLFIPYNQGVSAGVSQIVAGSNITLSPVGGTGVVQINATGGSSGVSQLLAGSGITLSPAGGTGIVSITATGGGSLISTFSTLITSTITGNTLSFNKLTSFSTNTVEANIGNLNILTGINMGGNDILNSGNIDLGGNNLNNVNAVNGEDGFNLNLTASTGNNVVINGGVPFTGSVGGDVGTLSVNSAGTVSFGTKGQLLGVSTINGVAYPPPAPTPTVSDTITGQNTYMTATGATFATANSIITSGGGLGGNIQMTASAGDLGVSGGNISLVSNGGVGVGGLNGVVNITANSGSDLVSGINTGGSINLTANSPTVGLTSKISLTAGGLNLYSGIFSPLASAFGYTFLNASLGTSIISGAFTPFPQSPGTTYIYSAQGTVIDNGLYTTDIQPLWDGNPLVAPAPLTIHGRYAGGSNVPVILNNVKNVSFNDDNDGAITGLKTINGVPYVPGTASPDLIVSTITFNPLGYISSLNQINTGILINDTGSKISFLPNDVSEYIGEFDGVKAINTNFLIGSFGDSLTFNTTGTIKAVSQINDVSFSGADITTIGNLGVNTNINLDSKGTITLNGLNGDPGQVIGIPLDDTVPRWVDAGGSYPTNPTFDTITMNTAGTISFTSGDGVVSGVSTLNAITLTDHDIGNVGQLQVQDGFTLEGAGTITLNGSSGSPGQYIGIPTDGTYPEWVSAVPAGGVATLNGLSGDLEITSTDGFATITPSGTTIDITAGSGGSYPTNATFDTITINTGGNIDFSDATGFLRTSAIYARDGDALLMTASSGQGISLLAGNANISVDGRANIIASTGLSEPPYCGYVFNSDGTANISQTLASGGGAISLDADGNIHITATGAVPDVIPDVGLFITATAMYFNGVLIAPLPV